MNIYLKSCPIFESHFYLNVGPYSGRRQRLWLSLSFASIFEHLQLTMITSQILLLIPVQSIIWLSRSTQPALPCPWSSLVGDKQFDRANSHTNLQYVIAVSKFWYFINVTFHLAVDGSSGLVVKGGDS